MVTPFWRRQGHDHADLWVVAVNRRAARDRLVTTIFTAFTVGGSNVVDE
jgi:hypothetical protein